jgi:hypothetical protein
VPAAKKQPPPKREYPAIYEKFVPFALGMVGLAILILVIITIIVALGLFPGGG